MRRVLLVLLLAAQVRDTAAGEPCAPGAAIVLDDLGTPWDDLVRSADTAGAVPPSPRVIRRGGAREEPLCADGAALPWTPPDGARVERGASFLRAVPLRLTSAFNSRYPSTANDELLWAGRGASALLSGGVAARWGVLSASLAPQVAWSENASFRTLPNGLTGDGRFVNPYYETAIDAPQRFGAAPYHAWAPGQSYVRVDAFNVGLGVSTENLWFGPGVRSAITMSNAGPGFPHAFVGTSRPADIWIGKAEVLAYWGRLERSPYMPEATHPLISGVVLDYTPRWLPDLTIGLSRNYTQVWQGLRVRDWFVAFQPFAKDDLGGWYGTDAGGLGNNPRDNQLASLFFRWRFPESGLELHGEWAREDHEASFLGIIREPDHSQAWLIGMEKIWRAGPRWVRFQAELVNLNEVRPLDAYRGTPVYYVHGNDLSWTNEGQLLGAWVGPGGSAQTLAVDVFGRGGRFGGYVERVRRTDDYYWRVVEPGKLGGHDAEIAGGLRQVIFAGPVDVSWDAAFLYRWNRDYQGNERNVRLGVQVSVPFGSR